VHPRELLARSLLFAETRQRAAGDEGSSRAQLALVRFPFQQRIGLSRTFQSALEPGGEVVFLCFDQQDLGSRGGGRALAGRRRSRRKPGLLREQQVLADLDPIRIADAIQLANCRNLYAVSICNLAQCLAGAHEVDELRAAGNDQPLADLDAIGVSELIGPSESLVRTHQVRCACRTAGEHEQRDGEQA